MNEKHIQELLEIERQAQRIVDTATREAEQLPLRAEREAQELIERARVQARQEAL